MSDMTLQWYTRARRLPRLIGKVPGGHDLPGGPYTVTQVVGTACVVVVGYLTMGLWGPGGGLVNYGILGVSALVCLIGLGFVKNTGRNPAAVGISLLGALAVPSRGKYRGRPIRTAKIHRVSHRIVACLPTPQDEGEGAFDTAAALTDVADVEGPTLPRPELPGEQLDEEIPQQDPLEHDVDEVGAVTRHERSPDGPEEITPVADNVPERASDSSEPAQPEQLHPMSNVQRLLADFDVKGRAS